MTEWRLFEAGTVPPHATPEWYAEREHAPHLEQPAHHGRLMLAAEMCMDALQRGASSFSDLGAGDGGLLSLLQYQIQSALILRWGYDLQPSNVQAAAQRGVDVRLQDAFDPGANWGDCAIATETIEHLVDPQSAVRQIRQRCRWLVASSPYTESAEHHYEFHLWAWDLAGYRTLMQQAGWVVHRHETIDSFQVILCKQPT